MLFHYFKLNLPEKYEKAGRHLTNCLPRPTKITPIQKEISGTLLEELA